MIRAGDDYHRFEPHGFGRKVPGVDRLRQEEGQIDQTLAKVLFQPLKGAGNEIQLNFWKAGMELPNNGGKTVDADCLGDSYGQGPLRVFPSGNFGVSLVNKIHDFICVLQQLFAGLSQLYPSSQPVKKPHPEFFLQSLDLRRYV